MFEFKLWMFLVGIFVIPLILVIIFISLVVSGLIGPLAGFGGNQEFSAQQLQKYDAEIIPLIKSNAITKYSNVNGRDTCFGIEMGNKAYYRNKECMDISESSYSELKNDPMAKTYYDKIESTAPDLSSLEVQKELNNDFVINLDFREGWFSKRVSYEWHENIDCETTVCKGQKIGQHWILLPN